MTVTNNASACIICYSLLIWILYIHVFKAFRMRLAKFFPMVVDSSWRKVKYLLPIHHLHYYRMSVCQLLQWRGLLHPDYWKDSIIQREIWCFHLHNTVVFFCFPLTSVSTYTFLFIFIVIMRYLPKVLFGCMNLSNLATKSSLSPSLSLSQTVCFRSIWHICRHKCCCSSVVVLQFPTTFTR